jgi:hypothetical protein
MKFLNFFSILIAIQLVLIITWEKESDRWCSIKITSLNAEIRTGIDLSKTEKGQIQINIKETLKQGAEGLYTKFLNNGRLSSNNSIQGKGESDFNINFSNIYYIMVKVYKLKGSELVVYYKTDSEEWNELSAVFSHIDSRSIQNNLITPLKTKTRHNMNINNYIIEKSDEIIKQYTENESENNRLKKFRNAEIARIAKELLNVIYQETEISDLYDLYEKYLNSYEFGDELEEHIISLSRAYITQQNYDDKIENLKRFVPKVAEFFLKAGNTSPDYMGRIKKEDQYKDQLKKVIEGMTEVVLVYQKGRVLRNYDEKLKDEAGYKKLPHFIYGFYLLEKKKEKILNSYKVLQQLNFILFSPSAKVPNRQMSFSLDNVIQMKLEAEKRLSGRAFNRAVKAKERQIVFKKIQESNEKESQPTDSDNPMAISQETKEKFTVSDNSTVTSSQEEEPLAPHNSKPTSSQQREEENIINNGIEQNKNMWNDISITSGDVIIKTINVAVPTNDILGEIVIYTQESTNQNSELIKAKFTKRGNVDSSDLNIPFNNILQIIARKKTTEPEGCYLVILYDSKVGPSKELTAHFSQIDCSTIEENFIKQIKERLPRLAETYKWFENLARRFKETYINNTINKKVLEERALQIFEKTQPQSHDNRTLNPLMKRVSQLETFNQLRDLLKKNYYDNGEFTSFFDTYWTRLERGELRDKIRKFVDANYLKIQAVQQEINNLAVEIVAKLNEIEEQKHHPNLLVKYLNFKLLKRKLSELFNSIGLGETCKKVDSEENNFRMAYKDLEKQYNYFFNKEYPQGENKFTIWNVVTWYLEANIHQSKTIDFSLVEKEIDEINRIILEKVDLGMDDMKKNKL